MKKPNEEFHYRYQGDLGNDVKDDGNDVKKRFSFVSLYLRG